MNAGARRGNGGSDDVIRMVLDDQTVARLRDAARVRGVDVEQLMIQLLVAVSSRIDEVLGPSRGSGGSGSASGAEIFRHDPAPRA